MPLFHILSLKGLVFHSWNKSFVPNVFHLPRGTDGSIAAIAGLWRHRVSDILLWYPFVKRDAAAHSGLADPKWRPALVFTFSRGNEMVKKSFACAQRRTTFFITSHVSWESLIACPQNTLVAECPAGYTIRSALLMDRNLPKCWKVRVLFRSPSIWPGKVLHSIWVLFSDSFEGTWRGWYWILFVLETEANKTCSFW